MNSSNIFNPSAIHNPPTILPQLLNGRAGEYRTRRTDEASMQAEPGTYRPQRPSSPLAIPVTSIPIHGTHRAIFWRLHQSRNKSSQSIPRKYERTPDAFPTLISVPRKPELGSQSTILIQSWRNLEISKPRETHRSPTKHFFRI